MHLQPAFMVFKTWKKPSPPIEEDRYTLQSQKEAEEENIQNWTA